VPPPVPPIPIAVERSPVDGGVWFYIFLYGSLHLRRRPYRNRVGLGRFHPYPVEYLIAGDIGSPVSTQGRSGPFVRFISFLWGRADKA